MSRFGGPRVVIGAPLAVAAFVVLLGIVRSASLLAIALAGAFSYVVISLFIVAWVLDHERKERESE